MVELCFSYFFLPLLRYKVSNVTHEYVSLFIFDVVYMNHIFTYHCFSDDGWSIDFFERSISILCVSQHSLKMVLWNFDNKNFAIRISAMSKFRWRNSYCRNSVLPLKINESYSHHKANTNLYEINLISNKTFAHFIQIHIEIFLLNMKRKLK